LRPVIAILENIHSDGIDAMREFATIVDITTTPVEECRQYLGTADAVVVKSVTQVNVAFLDAAKNLKVVARCGTGMDNIDVVAAEARGISVFNIPKGNSCSAAEFTLLMILCVAKRLPEAIEAVRNSDFRRHLLEGREIAQLTIGIIGLGNVGFRVALLLKPFGCRLLALDPHSAYSDRLDEAQITLCSDIDTLLTESDIVTLHMSLSNDVRHFLDEARLARMKKGAALVNCARAELVDEAALINALDTKHLSFAALDLLEPEPPYVAKPGEHDFRHSLLGRKDVLVTPHMAASTIDAQRTLALETAQRLREYLV